MRAGAILVAVTSALRFVLAAGWIALWYTARRDPPVLGSIAIVAAASDFLDGRLARMLRVESAGGRWLDALADVTFIVVALAIESSSGAIPAYIPLLVAILFTQYALDSLILGGPRTGPIGSRLGHFAGVVNFGLVIALAFAPATLGRLMRDIAPLLAVLYLAAMVERAARYPWHA